MKLNEIMIIREDGLKIFQVDGNVLSKLVRIRGNLYADDPRLRTVAELPTMIREPQQTAAPVITPEMHRKAEEALFLHKMMQAAGERSRATAMQPQPEPEIVLSFEERIKEDWRTRPDIRAEFVSLASYAAYCRAVRDGRCKAYGRG